VAPPEEGVPAPEPVVPDPVVPEPVVPDPVVPDPVSVIEVSLIVVSIIVESVMAESEAPSPFVLELHAAKTIPENARIIKGLKFIVFGFIG
jgi:hypothetical protein